MECGLAVLAPLAALPSVPTEIRLVVAVQPDGPLSVRQVSRMWTSALLLVSFGSKARSELKTTKRPSSLKAGVGGLNVVHAFAHGLPSLPCEMRIVDCVQPANAPPEVWRVSVQ